MQAQFVKPYVKSDENNFHDTAAIAKAMGRPTMRFVTMKTDQRPAQASNQGAYA